MFSKVLIANRGAIACRIIRTLDAMGVGSVAVFADADAYSRHVESASERVALGGGRVADTYMDVGKILAAAKELGVDAIHPGYGFLAENAEFAERCEAVGIAFVGPTPEQIRLFGEKHTAREIAERSGVPLLPGSPLIHSVDEAVAAAERIGYPVMLKSTAGGGGIGMAKCRDLAQLREAFDSVQRLAGTHFGNTGLLVERFVERARHVEVQIFGDGAGHVVSLGERDCSLQRRNQKIVEETPAPGLSDALRAQMAEAARRLAASVAYRSAGTVEFLYDPVREAFHFLEVNTRLQVEHGVTELVTGIDLVQWMIELAAGARPDFALADREPQGCSIQARLYAENPIREFEPSSGLVTRFAFPGDTRCDHWLTPGIEVSALYDPLLAKLMVHGRDRHEAIAKMRTALAATEIHGIETNRDFLRAVFEHDGFQAGRVHTSLLAGFTYESDVIEVVKPGIESTIQDWPGRRGYWHVGVPPSGPMDNVAHRIANRLLDNPEQAAALEFAVEGPTLRFHAKTRIAIAGADMQARLDGHPIEVWSAVDVPAGGLLEFERVSGPGQRTVLAVRGGFDVPEYLSSRSTFILGGFGGHGGRRLRTGDILRPCDAGAPDANPPRALTPELRPHYPCDTDVWEIDVTYGPHGAPEFFTKSWLREFFDATWEVHYNSSRTGIRLIGPKPDWARSDGGEAGLHPSNIHDNAYAIGTIDFTGDMPVILGLDGPSLGGFVCPATIVQADLWKMGQLSAGARVRFRPISLRAAREKERYWTEQIANVTAREPVHRDTDVVDPLRETPIRTRRVLDDGVEMVVRRSGDRFLLVEIGEMMLDLSLRLRVHALMLGLEKTPLAGILELTPGIRSLQIHYDSQIIDEARVLEWLESVTDQLPPYQALKVPTRTVHLPLAWDHGETRRAIEKYMQSVRPDAPWCPDNIEFIRRINGLDERDEVRDIVFDARYLVMGLGDVYLGAPVATPIDPRHRLVTTKYNPARTWTPENAVGIGGAYLCVYGMEGPGGYQFVGRTLQMWNRFRQTASFEPNRPWLLRFFDQLAFYPVTESELERMRQDFLRGDFELEIESGEFDASQYAAEIEKHREEIDAVRTKRENAFEAERLRWEAAGLAEFDPEASASADEGVCAELPADAIPHEAGLAASIWSVAVEEGQRVELGQPLVVLESMKTELVVSARASGTVCAVRCREGQVVVPGQVLVAVIPDPGDETPSA